MSVDQRIFDEIFSKKLSPLFVHLNAINFPLSAVTYRWFMCLFINSLPSEVSNSLSHELIS